MEGAGIQAGDRSTSGPDQPWALIELYTIHPHRGEPWGWQRPSTKLCRLAIGGEGPWQALTHPLLSPSCLQASGPTGQQLESRVFGQEKKFHMVLMTFCSSLWSPCPLPWDPHHLPIRSLKWCVIFSCLSLSTSHTHTQPTTTLSLPVLLTLLWHTH